MLRRARARSSSRVASQKACWAETRLTTAIDASRPSVASVSDRPFRSPRDIAGSDFGLSSVLATKSCELRYPKLLPTGTLVAILRGVVHGLGVRREWEARLSAHASAE